MAITAMRAVWPNPSKIESSERTTSKSHQFLVNIKAAAATPCAIKARTAILLGGNRSITWPVGTLRRSESAPDNEKASATFCAPRPTIKEK